MINLFYGESIGIYKLIILLFLSFTGSIVAVRWHRNKKDIGSCRDKFSYKIDCFSEKIFAIEHTALYVLIFVKYGFVSNLLMTLFLIISNSVFIIICAFVIKKITYYKDIFVSILIMIAATTSQILYLCFL